MAKITIIESPSGANPGRNCLLGAGKSEPEAWEDAFGPAPHSNSTRLAMKRASAREVDEAEADELRYG